VSRNFLGCDREQAFLLPPSLDEWLPEDHFARFVIAAVGAMDLSAFYADYRADGHGRPAHDPEMMVALLVYAYARGQRSSRVIERGCFEDIAFRVICANRQPDHTTIARFRQRHERALAALFGQVLGLCAQAGLAEVAVLAVDGTRVHANASERATRDYRQLAEEALKEAAEVDAAEDDQFGDRRGDELPAELATAQGRKKWLEAARRRLDAQRELEARSIPRPRAARVREAKRRLEEELATEVRANSAYEAYPWPALLTGLDRGKTRQNPRLDRRRRNDRGASTAPPRGAARSRGRRPERICRVHDRPRRRDRDMPPRARARRGHRDRGPARRHGRTAARLSPRPGP